MKYNDESNDNEIMCMCIILINNENEMIMCNDIM